MRTNSSLIAVGLVLMLRAIGLDAQAPAERPAGQSSPVQTIEARTAGFQKLDGYLPLYWDQKTGSLFMEINKFDTEMLYSTGLSAGLGSNDIGLDRGQSGQGRVVKFQRIGPRVLMVQPNYTFRANSRNLDERRAVEDAFATSILWGFTVGAESDSRVLVDATDFFLRDAHNVIPQLRPAPIGWTARGARLTCRGRRGFRKTPRLMRFSRSRATAGVAVAGAGLVRRKDRRKSVR